MTVPSQVVHVDSPTEQRNPRTTDIDRLPTLGILGVINAEDRRVPEAVGEVLPQLATAVDYAVEALRNGHRVHYVGAGTSGRLAVLDAAELVPTYNVPEDWFVAHHAGGAQALQKAVENAEDDATAGADELSAAVEPGDFVLGLTASGRTPYVLGALLAASRKGAHTGLVSGNARALRPAGVDVLIAVDTGPEVIMRLDADEGGDGAEADSHGLLDGHDGQARPHLLEPHGQHAGDERETARADAADPPRGDGRERAGMRGRTRRGGR